MAERFGTADENTLNEREAHVWSVALDAVSLSAEDARACLSPEEADRATRIRGVERSRFVASRVALRRILSRYHGGSATGVPLAREPRGRPFIEGSAGVFFSLTHSRNLALVAVALQPVGVDVEHDREVTLLDRIARRILHSDTVSLLERLPADERRSVFLDAWTQREAHVKAVGGGLFYTRDVLPFDPFMPADGSVRVLRSREDGSTWSMARFRPSPVTRATVVADGAVAAVRFMQAGDMPTEEDS